MDVFDKFFRKFAYKFDKGYPDLNNKQDILLLESLFERLGIEFIFENQELVQSIKTSKLFDIPNSAFIPKPKVDSTVIQIQPYKKPLYDVSFHSLEKITKIAFSQRRKMIKTSLKEINCNKILDDLNISPSLRPEQLSISDFCKIAKKAFED